MSVVTFRVSAGGERPGDCPGGDSGHRFLRGASPPHLETLHHHQRQAGAGQIREGGSKRQVGYGRQHGGDQSGVGWGVILSKGIFGFGNLSYVEEN